MNWFKPVATWVPGAQSLGIRTSLLLTAIALSTRRGSSDSGQVTGHPEVGVVLLSENKSPPNGAVFTDGIRGGFLVGKSLPTSNANEVRLEGLEAFPDREGKAWCTTETRRWLPGKILARTIRQKSCRRETRSSPTAYRSKTVVQVAANPGKLRKQSEQKEKKRLAGCRCSQFRRCHVGVMRIVMNDGK